MSDKPIVWHYGLMAERWAEFIIQAREVPFYLQQIERYGQPVLDVACGVGRVLLPIMRAGIDIDGCDISADMLQHCQSKASQERLLPHLYNQPMNALELPRTYKTIYICDSFGLAGGREKDLETLQRCHAYLEEGGALVVNIQAEYTSSDDWNLWGPEARRVLPQPWPEKGSGRIASDGSEHFGSFRLVSLDPLEQTYTREVHLEKWLNGELVAMEEYILRGNMYMMQEMMLMLKVTGFRDITIYGDYTDHLATADDAELVFVAVKQKIAP